MSFSTRSKNVLKAYFKRRYWDNTRIRRALGNTVESDSWNRCGRSFVQVTGRDNDIKIQKELKANYSGLVKDFENRSGKKFDLIKDPWQLLDAEIAYCALVVGCKKGLFTGAKLGRYISDSNNEFVNYKEARRVVNGVDQATRIANYALQFERIYKLSSGAPSVPRKALMTVQPVELAAAEPTVEPTTYEEMVKRD